MNQCWSEDQATFERVRVKSLRAEAKGTKARIIAVAPGGMDTPFWSDRRSDFMDPKEIAAIIVDAIERPVNVGEIVINR